jgi:hypothetical protein
MTRFWSVQLLSGALAVMLAMPASAATILYEPFDYPTGPFLQNTTIGATNNAGSPEGYLAPNFNNWYGNGINNTQSPSGYQTSHDGQVTSADLTVPGLYKPNTTNSLSLGGQGYTMRLSLNSSTLATPNQTAVNLTDTANPPFTGYYSFAFQVTSLGTLDAAGGILAGFNTLVGGGTGNPATVGAGLAIRPKAGGNPGEFELGVGKSQASHYLAAVWDTGTYMTGDTIFVVGKYETVAGAGNDDIRIWINPSSSTFQGAEPGGAIIGNTATGNDLANNSATNFHTLQSFMLRQSGNTDNLQIPNVIYDELRIGTTWASVTEIPEPSSLALILTLGAVLYGVRRRR